MDSWKYMSGGRGVCLPEELDFQYDNQGYNKSKMMGCEFKPLQNTGSYPLVSNTEALERLDFMEMGFSDEIRKSYSISSGPSGEVLSDEIGTDYGNVASPSFGEERDFGSRVISAEFMHSKDLSLVDLKLGRLADAGVGRDGKLSEASVLGSCIESSPQMKRPRSTNSYVMYPRCQVLGCNKDLASYKGYYKRHKVCDEHTRTARVTVNGREQRFCQQCSRFHQLSEFDDDKRSCRRRLAAHNKRRRKPRFPSEPGTGVINFSSSHGFSEALPTAIVGPSKFDEWNWAEHVKDEDFVESSNIFFHVTGAAENKKDIPADVKGNVIGTSTSMILNSSTVRQAGRALSLLSSQSHSASSQLLPAGLTSPLLDKNVHPDSNPGHVQSNSVDVFRDMAQNGFNETGMYEIAADNMDHTMITHNDSNTVDPHLPGVGVSRESDLRNTSLGRGIILDLLQLSSRLQKIEQQRHSTESEVG